MYKDRNKEYKDEDLTPFCFHRKYSERAWAPQLYWEQSGTTQAYICREPDCFNTVSMGGGNCITMLGIEAFPHPYYLKDDNINALDTEVVAIEISPNEGVTFENGSFATYVSLKDLSKLINEIKLDRRKIPVKETKLMGCTCGCNDQPDKM